MYGAPIIVDGFDYARKPRKIPGLVVHLVENAEGLRDYQGERNFFDGRGRLYRRLLDNKWAEFEMIRKIDPSVMPATDLAATLVKKSPRAQALRRRLNVFLNDFLKSKKEIDPAVKKQIAELLQIFFAIGRQAFPNGAFIKYIREFGTREVGQVTEIPNVDPGKMTDVFLEELEKIKSRLVGNGRRWLSPSLRELIQDSRTAALHIVSFLIYDPKQIMVQEKLDIAVARDGTLAEVRIDFSSTGALVSHLRWGYDVGVDYKIRAQIYFQNLWRKFPPDLKKLFGGADVVFLKDGSMKIIEFNFGCESGFLDAAQMIVPGNAFVSKILGRPTPLIARLENLIKMAPKAQVRELSKLIPKIKRDDETHYSLRDLHLPDVFLYIRDRMIEDWLKNPSRSEARRLSRLFRFLAQSQQKRIHDPQLRKLILDMARFGTEALLEFSRKHRMKPSNGLNKNLYSRSRTSRGLSAQ